MKKCSHCNKIKPLSEFGVKNRKLKDGSLKVDSNCYCKLCNSERSKKRYYDIKSKGISFVYRLLNDNNEVVYVGKTESLPTRTNQHFSKASHLHGNLQKEKGLRLQYVAMTSTNLMQIREIYYINKYKPKYNTIFMNNEPSIFISDFESDVWVDYEKFNDIIMQNKLSINESFCEIRSIFKRRRSRRYCVYVEIKTTSGKIKQIMKGSFSNEEDADKLILNIKEYHGKLK